MGLGSSLSKEVREAAGSSSSVIEISDDEEDHHTVCILVK
jgi:hypothetical protein